MIPLKKEWIAPVIFLFTISSFFNAVPLREFVSKLKRNWALLLFFIVALLGLIYSENLSLGWKNIETKLSLLIFPFVFSISKIELNTVKKKIFTAFLEGTLIAISFGICNVIYNYIQTDILSLFYGKLAYFNHNSYLSLYINLTIILLYSSVLFRKDNLNIPKYTAISLIPFLSIIVGLLASKAGLICLILIHIVSISIWVYKQKKYIIGLGFISSLFLFFFALYFSSAEFKQRIDEFNISVKNNNNRNTSTNARISTWKSSLEIIGNNLLIGVGTGDAQNELDIAHLKNGDLILYKKHLNAHNQFLQTGIATGVIGIVSLLLIVFVILYKGVKLKSNVLILFLLIVFINLLSESMLEKQEGVIFISFFITFFSTLPTSKQETFS